MGQNKLKLNPSKTEFVHQDAQMAPVVTLDGKVLILKEQAHELGNLLSNIRSAVGAFFSFIWNAGCDHTKYEKIWLQ